MATAGTPQACASMSATPKVSMLLPTIKTSLKKVNATKYWKNVITAYNKIPLVKKMNPNLEIYVTQRTIQGLFYIIEEEEIKIRENPKKRITGLLKKVFGS